jgi:hypothetical protein
MRLSFFDYSKRPGDFEGEGEMNFGLLRLFELCNESKCSFRGLLLGRRAEFDEGVSSGAPSVIAWFCWT